MEYVNGGEVSLKQMFCSCNGNAITGLHFKGYNFSFLFFLSSVFEVFFQNFYIVLLKNIGVFYNYAVKRSSYS